MFATIITVILIFLILWILNEFANNKLSKSLNIGLNAFEDILLLIPFTFPRNEVVKPVITVIINMLSTWRAKLIVVLIIILLVLAIVFYMPGPLSYCTYRKEIKDRNEANKRFPKEQVRYMRYENKEATKRTKQALDDLTGNKYMLLQLQKNYTLKVLI